MAVRMEVVVAPPHPKFSRVILTFLATTAVKPEVAPIPGW